MTISQADIDELLGQGSPPQPLDPSALKDASVTVPSTPPQLVTTPAQDAPRPDIRRILDLSVPVMVVLAERDMSVEMVLATRVGTIMEFDVSFDAELALHVANQPIGKGYAIKIGENFGLRITRIESVAERIEAMSGDSSST